MEFAALRQVIILLIRFQLVPGKAGNSVVVECCHWIVCHLMTIEITCMFYGYYIRLECRGVYGFYDPHKVFCAFSLVPASF